VQIIGTHSRSNTKMMDFNKRVARVSTTSHVVHLEDSSIHKVSAINTFEDEIYITTSMGLTFMDDHVLTLEEAARCERSMLKLYKDVGIQY